MTTATVEHPEPHRYTEDIPALATPAVAFGTDPGKDLEPTPEFKARIQRMMGAVAHPDDDTEENPVDDLAKRRRQVYAEAWENSLAAANVTDLADTTLHQLDDNQHGGWLRQYVDNIGPNTRLLNLVLGGQVGSGKTTAAIAAGNYAADRGLMVRFIQHATYLRWLRPDGAPRNMPDWQIRKRFRDCDLLILDDLAAGLDLNEPATKFVRDETTALIGDRIDTGKATIITTNVRAEHLEVMIDDRFVSRLSKRGHALKFTGEDRRGRLSW